VLIDDYVQIKKDKADALTNGTNETKTVINAYVVFRSMEGRLRALHCFNESWLRRAFDSCAFSCCCRSIKKKYFLKRFWLTVEPTMDPSLILWENKGYGTAQRWGR
jgi:hypothetical protein